MAWRASVLLVVLLLLALAGLFTWDGDIRLRMEASLQGVAGHDDAGDVASTVRPLEELIALVQVPDVWMRADIESIAQFEQKLKRFAGVVNVETPFTVGVPFTIDDNIEVRSLFKRIKNNPEQTSVLIEQTLSDPLIAGRMVDADKKNIAIRVAVKSVSEAEAVERRLLIKAYLDAEIASHPRLDGFVTGMPLIEASISYQIVKDLKNVLGMSLIIIPLILFVAFSGWPALVLPIISIFLSLLWTLSLMAMLNIPINLVTSIVPPLVIALTLAYSMHALFSLSESLLQPASESEDFSRLITPFLLTGITTIAGFLALSLQSMQAIREFSVAGALGVVCSLLAVVLVHCYAGRHLAANIRPRRWLTSVLMPLARLSYTLATKKRRWVIGIACVVILLGVVGASQIQPGARYVSDLPEDHPVRVDFDRISQAFGGGNGFEVIFQGGGPDSVLLPGVLDSIDQFQNWLNAQPEIGNTTSLVDYIKRLNQSFTTGHIEDFRLPGDLTFTKQMLMLSGSTEAQRYTNYENSKLIIRVNTSLDDVESMRQLFNRIDSRLATLPSGLTGYLSGSAFDLSVSVAKLTSGQVMSFGLALFVIYLVISAVFASLRMGMRAMLPNLFPIAVYYGMIGMLGVELSPTMALVACIVLGIAVDDTLFYLIRFNKQARVLASEKKAAAETLNEVIRPVTMTTIVLCLCFLSMANSQFDSTVTFALLASATLLAAWVADLTLTPAIGAKSSIVTLWDVLTLDLGESPEKTIPLFKDMSARQARLFALLSHATDIQKGECFIRIGDPAEDMYIVIEGEAEVWLEKDGKLIELARFKRGDLFGEVGGFLKHRTANVSALTDLHLLAFNFDTLEKIRRRYPRISALVYRNLNQTQAQRLESVNHRIQNSTHEAVASA